MKAAPLLGIDTPQQPPDTIVIKTVVVPQAHINFVVAEQNTQGRTLERRQEAGNIFKACLLRGKTCCRAAGIAFGRA